MKVKGELHVRTGGAIFVQQQLGSNQAYAERMSPQYVAESESERAGKVGNSCRYVQGVVCNTKRIIC